MKLKEMSIHEFNSLKKMRGKRSSELTDFIKKFEASGAPVAMIQGWEKRYKNVVNTGSALSAWCKSHSTCQCKIVRRYGNLYIINPQVFDMQEL